MVDSRRATRRSMAVVTDHAPPLISSGDDDPSVTTTTDATTRIAQPSQRRITTRARSRQPSPAVILEPSSALITPTAAAVAQSRRRSISIQKESASTLTTMTDTDDRRNLAKRRGRPPMKRPTTIETILESSSDNDSDVAAVAADPQVPRPQTPVERLLRAVLPSTTPHRNTPTPPAAVADTPEWSPRVMLRSSSARKRSTVSKSPSLVRTDSPSIIHDTSASDDDDEPIRLDDSNNETSAVVNRQRKTIHTGHQIRPSEFGGQWGCLLWLIFLPPAAIYLQTACVLTDLPADFWSLVDSFNAGTLIMPVLPATAVLMFAVFRVLHMVLALCKLGRQHTSGYFFERGTTLGVCLLALLAAEYFGLDPLVHIQRQYVPLCCVSVLHALGLSVRYYALRENRSGSGDRFWAALFTGADVQPQRKYAAYVSDKLVLHRMAVNGAFVLNAVLLVTNAVLWTTSDAGPVWEVPPCVQNAAAVLRRELQLEADVVSAVCAALVCVQMLWRALTERQLSASFEMNGERVGAQLLLRYALYPFASTLMAKVAVERRGVQGHVPDWALAAMAALYVVGLVLRHVADEAKWNVKRDNANDDDGAVRHPNYVGEMICTLALCLPLYWRFEPQPLLLALFHCAYLVHRHGRIQRRMT